MGAKILEKHITLDKKLPGPDHKASANPKDFKKMVEGIRKITIALGNGVKKISSSEGKNIKISKSRPTMRNIVHLKAVLFCEKRAQLFTQNLKYLVKNSRSFSFHFKITA